METIKIPLQEIDHYLGHWKTRISEMSASLIDYLEGGGDWSHDQLRCVKTLILCKKTLRDYRFQRIFLTLDEALKIISMGEECASSGIPSDVRKSNLWITG